MERTTGGRRGEGSEGWGRLGICFGVGCLYQHKSVKGGNGDR